MIRNYQFLALTLLIAAGVVGCTRTANENSAAAANTGANSNANVAVVTNSGAADPTVAAVPTPAGESKIPGIPNMPGTDKPISKEDPTRNAKPQLTSRSAPDNSEIFGPTLGENIVETRVFKNNAQIAKIESTTLIAQNNKKVVKVYLRNGQVRELPEGKVGDPMSESASNIVKVLSGGAVSETKTEPKAEAKPVAAQPEQPKKP